MPSATMPDTKNRTTRNQSGDDASTPILLGTNAEPQSATKKIAAAVLNHRVAVIPGGDPALVSTKQRYHATCLLGCDV